MKVFLIGVYRFKRVFVAEYRSQALKRANTAAHLTVGMPVDSDVIARRVDEARWAMSELRRLASKEFAELSADEKYAIRYNIIVLVETLASLCLHVAIEGFGARPATYREAVRLVADKLSVACAGDLESLVGLRNLLVHRYWVVDDEKVYRSVKANFKCVEELLSRVEAFPWR